MLMTYKLDLHKVSPFILLLSSLCAGCGSHANPENREATDQVATVQAIAAAPTPTPTQSIAPSPTATPKASQTPAPSPTPSASPSPQPSPSSAPTPPASKPATPPAPPPGTPSTNPTASAIPWPSLDFVDNPGGSDPKAVALTFDDGPDGSSGYGGTNNTAYILDQLKALHLQATFFLCDHVWTDVASDTLAQQDIQRMISEGHDVANHTFDHDNLSSITSAQIDTEFAQNADALAIPQALGTGFQMSMYRVPFGVPYQDNTSDVARIAPITVKYGVHIGWGIDTNDWECAQSGLDTNCVIDNLNAQLDKGHAGVILMHAVYKLTGDALPAVVQSINAHGLHIVSVEQLVQDKYGMSSAQIASIDIGSNFTSQQISNAAQNACSGNDFDIDPPYPSAAQLQSSAKE